MLVIIDNYDSFTYNLVQVFGQLQVETKVLACDRCSLAHIASYRPSHIVISPGPGAPSHAGLSMAVIRHFAGRVPLLGVCLGHQAIGQVFGCQVVHAPSVAHGKVAMLEHSGHGLFAQLPNPLRVTRYHSLVLSAQTLASHIEVTATLKDSPEPVVMAIAHRFLPISGVQFHPESVLSESGQQLLANFLMQHA